MSICMYIEKVRFKPSKISMCQKVASLCSKMHIFVYIQWPKMGEKMKIPKNIRKLKDVCSRFIILEKGRWWSLVGAGSGASPALRSARPP